MSSLFKVSSPLIMDGGFGFPGGSVSKESACNVGDLDSIPGLGRFPGEGNSFTHSSILAWRLSEELKTTE